MLFIISGRSASGKDTLQKALLNDGLNPLILDTTRPIRDGETDGVDYNFISKEDFRLKKAKGLYLEDRSYDTLVKGVKDTWCYATPKQELDQDKDYVIVMDIPAISKFKEYYKDCISVYIDVNADVRKQRASERGSFDETEWNRRELDDEWKFTKDMIKKNCDYIVHNNNNCTLRELRNTFHKMMNTVKEEENTLE